MSTEPASLATDGSNAPPIALDWARVIAYAIVDSDVKWTGRLVHYQGDERLGPVPRLAICQNVFGGTEDILLFFCNDDWEVVGATGRTTIEELQDSVERWYAGITPKWVYTGVTAEATEKWLREENAQYSCAFCRKLPAEVENMFCSGPEDNDDTVYICYACVEELHAAIHAPADESPST
jgi:hypothetical protein